MIWSLSKKIFHLFSYSSAILIPHLALAGAPLEPVLHPNLHDITWLEQHLHLLDKVYPCNWHEAYERSGHNLFDLGNGIRLLEFSCTVGMHNLASLYVRISDQASEPARLVKLYRPAGQPETSPYILFNSFWDLNRIALTSFTVDRGLSDCGSYEVHRFTPEGNLELIEYRAKRECDGKFREPTQYPLIYPTE